MEELLFVVAGLLGINGLSRLRRRLRFRPERKPGLARFYLRGEGKGGSYGLGQPVKRFKSKIRLLGKPKRVYVGTQGQTTLWRGVDAKNWVRFYPNPGYRIAGKHWCLRKHKTPVEWKAEV